MTTIVIKKYTRFETIQEGSQLKAVQIGNPPVKGGTTLVIVTDEEIEKKLKELKASGGGEVDVPAKLENKDGIRRWRIGKE